MNRRKFIYTGLGVVWAGSLGGLVQSCTNENPFQTFKGKRLVILKLDGGNDPMFSFAPAGIDLLEKLRPSLYKKINTFGIAIGDWNLHPNLLELHELMLTGDAVLVPNVGYPSEIWSGSHFSSANIWETGTLREKGARNTTGWIGKMLDEHKFQHEVSEWPVIRLDDGDRLFDRGQIETGLGCGPLNYATLQPYAENYLYTNKAESKVEENLLRLIKLNKLINTKEPLPGFTNTNLGIQMAMAARMIQERFPVKILHIAQNGYDTHEQAEKRLSTLYTDLMFNLALFVKLLRSSNDWNDTQIFIYSEFGRTLDENKNGGTDHGMAGHVLILGGKNIISHNDPFTLKPAFNVLQLEGTSHIEYQNDLRHIHALFIKEWLM